MLVEDGVDAKLDCMMSFLVVVCEGEDDLVDVCIVRILILAARVRLFNR